MCTSYGRHISPPCHCHDVGWRSPGPSPKDYTLVLPRSSGGSCGRDESDIAAAQIEAEADLTTAQAMGTMLMPPRSRQ